MFRIWRSLTLLAAASLMLSTSAAAQRITSPYRYVEEKQSVGPFGGHLSTDRGELGFGPTSGPIFGAGYSLRLTGPLQLEAMIGYFPTTRAVLDTIRVDGQPRNVGEADVDLLFLQGGFRFNLTGPRTYHHLRPFLLATGGIATAVRDDHPEERFLSTPTAAFRFGTSFAAQVGGGIEWFVVPHVSLRVEARDLFWELDTPQAFRLQGEREDDWVHNLFLSASVTYNF